MKNLKKMLPYRSQIKALDDGNICMLGGFQNPRACSYDLLGLKLWHRDDGRKQWLVMVHLDPRGFYVSNESEIDWAKWRGHASKSRFFREGEFPVLFSEYRKQRRKEMSTDDYAPYA